MRYIRIGDVLLPIDGPLDIAYAELGRHFVLRLTRTNECRILRSGTYADCMIILDWITSQFAKGEIVADFTKLKE